MHFMSFQAILQIMLLFTTPTPLDKTGGGVIWHKTKP